MLNRSALTAALKRHGLTLRGGFIPTLADPLPALADGRAAAVVWMVGVVGSGFWTHFTASAFFKDGLPDPLDRWSAHIGQTLATQGGGRALFPFDGPPYHPFQQWADRSEPTQSSAMMLRMHPQYGLWHAYRFALALPELDGSDAAALTPVRVAAVTGICAACAGQPCLRACPVGAYTGERFQVDACAAYLHAHPDSTCMQQGCLARRACPEGLDYRYTPAHATFHMQAFVKHH